MSSDAKLVSGGFYITRATPPAEYLGDALLPERILTLSDCLAEMFPGTWALEWVSCSKSERLDVVKKLGFRSDALPSIMKMATDAFDRGDLGWPFVWQSSEAARSALSAFGDILDDFVIIELGLPADQATALVKELEPDAGIAECGFLTCLKAARRLGSSGLALGWEVLGVEVSGSFHSWLCNSIHELAYTRLNSRPGTLGLLSSESDARAIEALIAGGAGAEPVPWFRGVLNRLEGTR